jgi:hypothetical protein
MEHSPSKMCWICGMAVALEFCKVDERGLPVHDKCYVAKVARKKNASSQLDQSLRSATGRSGSDDSEENRA